MLVELLKVLITELSLLFWFDEMESSFIIGLYFCAMKIIGGNDQ